MSILAIDSGEVGNLTTVHIRRTIIPAFAALLTTVTLTLSACSSGSEDDNYSDPVDVAINGVVVKVLNSGTGPTEPLAWFNDDAKQTSIFRVTQGLGQHTIGGDPQGTEEGTLPYSEVTMELPLTAVTSTDGEDLESIVTVGTPTGDNVDRNSDIATAEGFRMVQSYSDEGKVTARSFATPDTATKSARASVEQGVTVLTDLPLVFPTEALGAGARWTVTSQVADNSAGVAMKQVVTYSLTERKDSQVELGVKITRSPTVKQMAGTDLVVMDSTSTSSGTLTLDLRRPLPVNGSVKTTTVITYGQPGSPVSVVQESRTTSTWSATEDSTTPAN